MIVSAIDSNSSVGGDVIHPDIDKALAKLRHFCEHFVVYTRARAVGLRRAARCLYVGLLAFRFPGFVSGIHPVEKKIVGREVKGPSEGKGEEG